jgi:hypothetical protein
LRMTNPRKTALTVYRRRLRELAARMKAKTQEEKRSGLTAANDALNALYDRLAAVHDEIWTLPPSAPNAAAALTIP